MILPSLDKLQKIFKLEAERGYDNRAVVGGLDKVLATWEAAARADNLPEDQVQLVFEGLRRYAQVEPEERAGILKQIWISLKISRDENPLSSIAMRKKTVPAAPAPAARPVRPAQPVPQPKPEPPAPQPQPAAETTAAPASVPAPAPPAPQAPLREEPAPVPQPVQPLPRPRPSRPEERFTAQDLEGLNAPLTVISGIGPRHAETLSGLGLNTLGDLLYYFPRRYDDFSQLKPINRLKYGEEVTLIASIQSVANRPLRGGAMQMTEAVVGDGTGFIRLVWFNQPWQAKRLKPGDAVAVAGKIDQYLGRPVINNPECEPLDQDQLSTNRIVPVYSLTAKVTQRALRRLIYDTVMYWAPRLHDYLPYSVRDAAGLVDLSTAIQNSHFPASEQKLRQARERLAFDEIFLLQLGVLRQKQSWQSAAANTFSVSDDWLADQTSRLPYTLTQAQQRVIAEIRADFESGHPMNRLLQGDVGSGKTIVAGLAAAIITSLGGQAAFMAPTGILAEQHYRNLSRLLAVSDDNPQGLLQPEEICLLLGDTSAADKETIRQQLADGRIKLIIGTHALIESPIAFNNLELVVVDEQHRFGVAQRAMLRSKGTNPHLLVMTATPIPRSLALTLYGDLDLSVMDEMPAGRQVIETHVLNPLDRERAYSLIRSQVEKGRQAFIIYPLVEQSETSPDLGAVEESQRLQNEIFPQLKVGLMHGRLKPEEKDEVMKQFRDGAFHILVSTSVVEVGVDVPNATVMLIEGANRFGLAQLHQFRGRVGRGSEKSYCLLIPDSPDGTENERLAVMAETSNGFVLAERDLEQRGPGDFVGTRQAGFSELKMVSLTNIHLIEKARQQAQRIFKDDPDLTQPENQPMQLMLRRFWQEGQGDIS
ncbi:MAG TPA: ATP-dependent DNA helicase RecG [Anaerolineaceae bacterium]|nr:ATP-dependent DNA helicase RecG [Anaerolineaceae bacterium]HPN52521.1 ATP-dependent DNA helicase RecG [Anaerolineaceae bacterium]